MPGNDGARDAREATGRARPDVPVVFLTGAPKVEDTMRAIELGAFRYLAKPIDSTQMNNVVARRG